MARARNIKPGGEWCILAATQDAKTPAVRGTPRRLTQENEAPMCSNNSTPNPTNKQLQSIGFISAAPLADGDVIGVYLFDDDTLELRWVDAMTHNQMPLTFSSDDLSRIEALLSGARALLESDSN